MKIYIAGGIGNQLFQIAFAHSLQKKYRERKIEVCHLRSRKGLAHTRNDLLERFNICGHVHVSRPKKRTVTNFFTDPWSTWSKSYYGSRRIDLRNDPCASIDDLGTTHLSDVIVGYFQNVANVLNVREELVEDLNKLLIPYEIPRTLRVGDYSVIHIRRGDTLSSENKSKMGVLDFDYYRRIVQQRGLSKLVVVTNDLTDAERFAQELEAEYVFDDSITDVFTTLQIMRNCRTLVCANSTFSWWGGLLASEIGGQVIIPTPFYKNPNLFSEHAFKLNGFQVEPAIFL